TFPRTTSARPAYAVASGLCPPALGTSSAAVPIPITNGYLPFPGGTMRQSFVAMIGAISLSIATWTLEGCKVGPDFKRPEVALNDAWSAKSDPRVATQTAVDVLWWKSFNDPALDRLVELSYQQNLPLQIAGLKIMEARAQLGIATGMQYPQQQE